MKDRPAAPILTALFLAAEAVIYAVFLTMDILSLGSTILWKASAIALCLLFSLLRALQGREGLVTLAMAFTAGADWFLLVRNDHLMVGVALFLCVQAIYLIRLRRLGAPQAYWLRAGLALLAGLGLYALDMATPLNLLAGLYFSQLLSNTLLAWTIPNRRFALGLTLFVGCDICVGLFNSGLVSGALYQIVSVGMWLFYLPSQVLIVLSALPKEVPHENK